MKEIASFIGLALTAGGAACQVLASVHACQYSPLLTVISDCLMPLFASGMMFSVGVLIVVIAILRPSRVIV